jgi:phage tail-like protein
MGFRKNAGLFFRLSIEGFSDQHSGDFAEVSGINVRSGHGQADLPSNNLYKQFVPSPPKHANITLKKGILKGLILIEWLQPRYESLVFTTRNLSLMLIDEMGTIYSSWQLVNAYPVSIKLAFSEVQENVLIVETLELSYNTFIKTS